MKGSVEYFMRNSPHRTPVGLTFCGHSMRAGALLHPCHSDVVMAVLGLPNTTFGIMVVVR